MNLKKKLGMGIASAALGISLIGGGTFAYFNDVETTNNTFAAGTLDLAVNPATIIDVSNLKPGDWMYRTFQLENNGTLDISKVLLTTHFDDASDEFAKHIKVNFLINEDKSGILGPSNVITSKTLYELKNLSPDAVDNVSASIFGWQDGERDGLKANTSDKLHVQFEFVDNGQDQNEFQNASLALTWKFDAKQTRGQSRP
ncbi:MULTISPECIES: TasA family protein [unclassified Cytobacillus]|uniref:TasA family protein n=1 Tax=unclassified Cytobacillus TaxID=2675268 RepID=UPI00203EBD0C|nr:TasA family protein [Cytobacillus sp. AMY 15.2]MCM3090498.1 CalY family protein [Cytobacillus sp. AMY 15.2]